MPRKMGSQPTEVEMDILKVLWEQGPLTLGDLHQAIAAQREVAYSTTRKMTQVMREKGLIKTSGTKPLVYSAAKSKKRTQDGLVNDLARRAFGGSAKELMLNLLSSKSISDTDLAEIQNLIDAERKKKK